MNKIWTVAAREFHKTVFTKAFILGTFVFPIVVWAAFPIVVSITKEAVPELEGSLAVVSDSAELHTSLRREFDAGDTTEEDRKAAMDEVFENPKEALANEELVKKLAEEAVPMRVGLEFHPSAGEIEALRDKVASGELIGVAVIPDALLEPVAFDDEPVLKIVFSDEVKHQHVGILRNRISEAVVDVRVQAGGGDVEALRALMRRPQFATAGIDESGEEKQDTTGLQRVLPIFFMILLWLATMTSGQYILSSTVEEKSTKVIEVLLSAVSPMQLMSGRILGEFLVACLVLAMYGGAGIAALGAFATLDLIDPIHLVYFGIYFVIAYLVLASVMACIGSAVNDMVEAQTLMMPVMMIFIMGPMLVMVPASQDPGGLIANLLSFIPPFIPYVMMVRIPSGEVPFWQIVASLVVGGCSVYISIWMASRIFRIGVMVRGKAPNIFQLLRWIGRTD